MAHEAFCFPVRAHRRPWFEAGYRFIDTISPDSIGGYAVRVGLPETILLVAVNFVTAYWDRFAPYGTVNTVRELFFERLVERVLRHELDWAIVLSPPKAARVDYREIVLLGTHGAEDHTVQMRSVTNAS